MHSSLRLNAWWANLPQERYWLEVTNRVDIGANLKAPQTNEKGREFWSYSLLQRVRPGDAVYHYDTENHSIAARSTATGSIWEDEIVWAARGTFAREAGVQPHRRAGWYVGLEDFRALSSPVSIDDIRAKQSEVATRLNELKARVGSTYFPFEDGSARPIRPLQGYLFKLPSFFIEIFLSDSSEELTPQVPLDGSLGTNYRAADEDMSVAERDPFSIDPALVERGTRAHAATQNSLARYVRSLGIEPLSPGANDPNFDIAWQTGTAMWVAEVKSVTHANEEKQLRLGLGQVLRYRDLVSRASTVPVHAVLVLEREPSDFSWQCLCTELEVTLVWPEVFGTALKD